MMRLSRIPGLLILLALFPDAASAWTEATRRRMLEDALKLTPPSLATILDRYRADLIKGMTDPCREEPAEEHRQRISGSYGKAARMIASRSDQAIALIGKPGRLPLAVYALGNVAHFVSDVDFPLNNGDGGRADPAFYAAYQRYAERILGRFPVVLDAEPRAALHADRLEQFGKEAARHASVFIPPIRAAYTPDGKPKSPGAFDERSLPFGVVSLSYSRAVNDVARVWMVIWKEAGGTLEDLPFPTPAAGTGGKTGKVQENAGNRKAPPGAAERPR